MSEHSQDPFTVFRYLRSVSRSRVRVAGFKRDDCACTYAETLAKSTTRSVAARWAHAVAMGKPYQAEAVLAYAVDGCGALGYFPVGHPDPCHVDAHNRRVTAATAAAWQRAQQTRRAHQPA